MTFRELLEKYKKGTATEAERALVEAELEKSEAIADYLAEGLEALEEGGERPSLVLRTLGRGERLWDLAKTYGTTIADIISANELEGEAAAEGRLLLIPRRR